MYTLLFFIWSFQVQKVEPRRRTHNKSRSKLINTLPYAKSLVGNKSIPDNDSVDDYLPKPVMFKAEDDNNHVHLDCQLVVEENTSIDLWNEISTKRALFVDTDCVFDKIVVDETKDACSGRYSIGTCKSAL